MANARSVSPASKAVVASIQCDPGYVYSISGDGQLYQVQAESRPIKIGSHATGGNEFNGLGIGADGQGVYAYLRTSNRSKAQIYQFNQSSGQWSSENADYQQKVDSPWGGHLYNGTLIAGAVNLANGKYLFGGFEQGSVRGAGRQVFQLWQYDPSAQQIQYLGYLDTTAHAEGAANGDMAFDAAGNLFVVRSSGPNTTVFSVTAQTLTQANGGYILSSDSTPFQTTENVNGVAFDAAGKAYLGSGGNIQSFNMPNWGGEKTFNSKLDSSTDLASCSSPAAVTVQKVVNGRVNVSDQFAMSLRSGSQVLGTATTEGTKQGLQDQRIGPQPTARGTKLQFSEAGANGADLKKYATTYQCMVDGGGNPISTGSGPSGEVTIPATGQSVVCQFTNSPLTARVRVSKTVLDKDGGNPQPGRQWTVGVATTPVSGTAVQTPGRSQQTDDQGHASWDVDFDAPASSATVHVDETQQPGYQFTSGQCVVTDNNGDRGEPVQMTSEDGVNGLKVVPGDAVDCSFTNKKQGASLQIIKSVKNEFGGNATPDDFGLTATPKSQASIPFASGETKDVEPGDYTIGEKNLDGTGYRQNGIECKAGTTILSVGNTVHVADAQHVICTVSNSDQPGSVVWSKNDEHGGALGDSEWSLTGPGVPEGTIVKDCTAARSCGTGPYDDQDPRAGKFSLLQQHWGDYSLREHRAPAGYELSDEFHGYTISAKQLDYAFAAAFTNKQRTSPTLPLTGGMSTDSFLIGGTTLIVLSIGAGLAWRRRTRLHS